jgi:hypothetical protein
MIEWPTKTGRWRGNGAGAPNAEFVTMLRSVEESLENEGEGKISHFSWEYRRDITA